MVARPRNWAGNIEFEARRLEEPDSLDRLREIVTGHDRVRVLGTGHSFNRIADTTGVLVSLRSLPRAADLDPARGTVRVDGGTRLDELCAFLRRHGLALPDLPSSPHFTVAGACATGTHGSAHATGTLASFVTSVELLTWDGSTVVLTHGDADFGGAVTSLGALGVVTALSLRPCSGFEVEQRVYEEVGWDVLTDRFTDVFTAAHAVSAFTDWSAPVRLWVKHRVGAPRDDLGWTGARAADAPRHPIAGMPAGNATEQLGTAGPWDERLPHFRAGSMPSAGAELQSEYFVPLAAAAPAVEALREAGAEISPMIQTAEIRVVAADDCWLSPSHGRDSVAFHFTWVPEPRAVASVIARVEEALAPFDPRPHWGKLSALPPEGLRASYEYWDDFRRLVDRLDPVGRFRNALIDHYFPAPSGPAR
ncbi:FAD-binding protein [Marinactinospora thermotolerans]|uniref:FAD-binding protein n=1 Tax=Marinactinospora thermotolerans TaxID=531310 RepID=UPI003D8DC8FF